jgi:PKD repeat protein
MKNLFSLALVLACGAPSLAQDHGPHPVCRHNDLRLAGPGVANDASLLARIAASNAELEAFTEEFAQDPSRGGGSTYVIPVVFHIIHNNGPENIPDANIEDAIRILNEDFNKLNPDWANVRPDFLDRVADVGIEFRLATKDPQGNCTRGITRTVSTLTNEGESGMKALIQWPRNKYLNVWVCANAGGAGVAGYTMTPGAAQWLAGQDGIVVRYNYIGSLPPSSPSGSRTLTHEVGHWINLSHTWGSSNNPGLASNCSTDDGVADTPNTQGWTSCNVYGSTCDGTLDNVENFMEYSFCSKMFTEGQKTRMLAALNSATAQRSQLWTPSNLAATGVSETPPLCAAAFTSNTRIICPGGSVSFTDQSYHNVTSRTWTFEGGTPATSADPNVTVTYSTPGTYAVTLEASDGSGTVSTTQAAYITVLPNPGANVPFSEGFESLNNYDGSAWIVDDPGNDNTFQVTTAAAYSGSKSTRIVNTAAMDGQKDALISTTYDMSNADQVVLSFRYAYARRNTSNDDILRVYVSNNCGASWSPRKTLRGSNDLNTAGNPVTSSFIPSNAQWGYAEVTNISNSFHVSNFRVKFEFESDGGNNLYLDDININGQPVGFEELLMSGAGLAVVPNPAHGQAQALVELPVAERVTLTVEDVLGRRVAVAHQGTLQAGTQRIDLPIDGLVPGVYLLRLQHDDRFTTVRFVVE